MDKEIIANIKSLALDMIEEAGNGSPGLSLSSTPILYTLYSKHLNISTSDTKWLNRDRFILSPGLESAALYATIFYAGYDLLIDDLKKYYKFNSRTPGFPDYLKTDGIDISTGLPGVGFAQAVGMAIGEKILETKYIIPSSTRIERDRSLINYKIYVLCTETDMMEGITNEAASLAGNLNLDNLIVLYDSNNITLDGDTSITFTEKTLDKFKALGWYTETVKNGNDVTQIDKAIDKAKSSGMPSIIEIKTILGDGSLLAGSNEIYNKPLEPKDIEQLKQKLELPLDKFYVNDEAVKDFRKRLLDRSSYKYEEWSHNYKIYVEEVLKGDRRKIDYLFKNEINIDLLRLYWDIDINSKQELKLSNQMVIDKISSVLPNFIGGSCDLVNETNTKISKSISITDGRYNGKNINFGNRETAMGAILNGLAISGFRPFGSTYLALSDYVKPQIRQSALMHLPVTYIFTHDNMQSNISSPIYQPVEQLSNLRSIPNLFVFRPADIKELIGCWNIILNTNNNPSALIVSKNQTAIIPSSDAGMCGRGAYIVRKETKLHGTIIATGTDVNLALVLANDLFNKYKLDLRVVSMPCMEIYNMQNQEYKDLLIPKGYRTFVLESGSSMGWEKFVYDNSYLITIDNFGTSGSKGDIEKYVKYDFMTIRQRILDKFTKK